MKLMISVYFRYLSRFFRGLQIFRAKNNKTKVLRGDEVVKFRDVRPHSIKDPKTLSLS